MKLVRPHYTIITPMPWAAMMEHVEYCGRISYQTEELIAAGSAAEFVRKLIHLGHESVLEHASFTVIFEVNRGVTHEVVRHRIASPTQESTRYCNYSLGKFSNSVTYTDPTGGALLDVKMSNLPDADLEAIMKEWMQGCLDAERHYFRLLELGATTQFARGMLNESTKAQIAITTNIREWRLILGQRSAPVAHPQMREVIVPLLLELKEECSPFFSDIVPDPITVGKLHRLQEVFNR